MSQEGRKKERRRLPLSTSPQSLRCRSHVIQGDPASSRGYPKPVSHIIQHHSIKKSFPFPNPLPSPPLTSPPTSPSPHPFHSPTYSTPPHSLSNATNPLHPCYRTSLKRKKRSPSCLHPHYTSSKESDPSTSAPRLHLCYQDPAKAPRRRKEVESVEVWVWGFAYLAVRFASQPESLLRERGMGRTMRLQRHREECIPRSRCWEHGG